MKSRSAIVLAPLVALLAAGCAENGALTTGSINPSVVNEQQAKEAAANKAACATLAAQIEELNKGGVAEKVEKAAAKKYKIKTADLAKANELNKANAEFQAKCSNYPTMAALPKPEDVAADGKDAKTTAKAETKPPVPPRKSAAQAAAPKPQAAQAAAAAPAAKTAAAPKPTTTKTEAVAAAEPETKQASTEMASSPTIPTSPFSAPRLSAAPTAVTTTSGTP